MQVVEPEDDETIEGATLLFRRIPFKPNFNIVWDGNTNCWRPSSASFDNHPNGTPMSVVLSDTLHNLNRKPDSVLAGHSGFSLAAFSAKIARECDQKVARDPIPDEPAHGVVIGDKSKKIRRTLAKNSIWVIPPEN